MLRRVSGIVAVVAAVAAAAPPAKAQPAAPAPPSLGIDLGLQVGFGLPYGRLNESIPLVLNKVISSMVPIAVDLAYRADDWIAVGIRLQYGILQFSEVEGTCAPAVNCRGSQTTVAAHVTAHLPVSWRFVPWLRLGTGYEWLVIRSTSEVMGAPDPSLHLRGWMFGFAEVGADYAALSRLTVGPFVGLSVGRYSVASENGSDFERDLIYKRVHEWLIFGVGGTFSL